MIKKILSNFLLTYLHISFFWYSIFSKSMLKVYKKTHTWQIRYHPSYKGIWFMYDNTLLKIQKLERQNCLVFFFFFCEILRILHYTAGQKILKKTQAKKNLVKSNRSITRKHFLNISENGTYPKKFREIDSFHFKRFFCLFFLNVLAHSPEIRGFC